MPGSLPRLIAPSALRQRGLRRGIGEPSNAPVTSSSEPSACQIGQPRH